MDARYKKHFSFSYKVFFPVHFSLFIYPSSTWIRFWITSTSSCPKYRAHDPKSRPLRPFAPSAGWFIFHCTFLRSNSCRNFQILSENEVRFAAYAMPTEISSPRIAPISVAVVAGLRRMAAIKARSRNPPFTSFGHIGKNYRKFPVNNLFSQFHHYHLFFTVPQTELIIFRLKICSFDRSIDWLIVRLIDWLINWLFDRSIDWLIDWLV